MKRERRVNEVMVHGEVLEGDLGVGVLFRRFIYAVTVLLSLAFLTFLLYYAKINEPYHPTGVDLTYQDKQVLAEWRERVLYQNIIEDNPLIEPVKILTLIALLFIGFCLMMYFIAYLKDRKFKKGVSNYLAITSVNRFRVDYSGKLLVYRNEDGSINKYRIKRDILLFGILVICLAMFVCVGFVMEVL